MKAAYAKVIFMPDLNDIARKLSSHKGEMANRFKVKDLAIFGSYARNEHRDDSDVDLLVEFDSQVGVEFIDLADYLENLLQLRVDLVSKNGIRPAYFGRISKDLMYV
jgi:predicted nucleotidyltransferase